MPYLNHLFYEERGGGQPVLLLHCPALSRLYWQPLMDRLETACHLIAPDIRGHGKSNRGDESWTFGEIAADLNRLMDELDLRDVILVAYSSASCIALEAALTRPALYSRLVLVSGLSECTTLFLRTKVRAGLLAVSLGLSGLVGRSVAATNYADRQHYAAMLPEAVQVHPTALRSFLTETLRCRLTHLLPQVQVPVTLVYGTDDEPMHSYYRIMRQGLPNATATFFPKSDHRVPTRQPEVFAALIASLIRPDHPEPMVQTLSHDSHTITSNP